MTDCVFYNHQTIYGHKCVPANRKLHISALASLTQAVNAVANRV